MVCLPSSQFSCRFLGDSGHKATRSNDHPPEQRCLNLPLRPHFAGVTHTTWTRRDGAPGSISCLAQTKNGYLWVGSTLGLYRFDGLRFSSYPFGSAGSALPSLDVASLAADLEGGLWVALRNSHVVHLKADGRRVNYDQSTGLTGSIIDKIMALPDGSVWISGSSQLFRLEGDRWFNFGNGHGLGHGGVFSVFFDREGSIWIGRDKRLSILKKAAQSLRMFQCLSTTSAQWPKAALGSFGSATHGVRYVL